MFCVYMQKFIDLFANLFVPFIRVAHKKFMQKEETVISNWTEILIGYVYQISYHFKEIYS